MGKPKALYEHFCVMCDTAFASKVERDYICDDCVRKMKLIKKIEVVDSAEERLLKGFSHGKWDKFNERTKKSANIVRKRVFDGVDNFGSKQEAMVAIQLERNGVMYETQKDIGGYKVDFCIPQLKMVLEIDGILYHTNDDKAFLRDRKIMSCLGERWEIVHLEDCMVPEYTWNLYATLPMIVEQRNENFRFRDTRSDSMFLKMIVGSRK